ASIQNAAVPVIQSTDTLREVDDKGTLKGILDREHVVRIQTPQVFLTDMVKGALTDAVQRELSFTDDAMAVERLGVAVYSVPGDEDNIKLTTPRDMAVAEEILKRRRETAV
ncbi:MAG: 2-C-methyl-D-erythritol 4-phosphate cytidylyltransferase, partial [Candidatus Limivicinus sp.]